MRHDLYAWAGPRDLSAEEAADRIEQWEARGGALSDAPFEPSSDVAGFYRELEHDLRDAGRRAPEEEFDGGLAEL